MNLKQVFEQTKDDKEVGYVQDGAIHYMVLNKGAISFTNSVLDRIMQILD